MTVQSTTQTTATTTTQYSTTQKTASSDFEETLNQTQNTTQASTEPSEASKEAHFKYVERFSYEFIKNSTIEQRDNSYNDLSEEEQAKIGILRGLSKLTENDTYNQTLFEKAKNMTPKQANDFFFEKGFEVERYKRTGSGQLFLADTTFYNQGTDGKYIKNENPNYFMPQNHKLTHNETFDFLMQMVNSSKEGMDNPTSNNELRGMFENVYEEYSQYLQDYNTILKKNLTGNV